MTEESAPSDTAETPLERADGGLQTSNERRYIENVAVSDGNTQQSRVRQILTVAGMEYRLAVRSRWALALVALFTLFGTMLATFSGSAVGPKGMERVIASLASLAIYLIPLAALAVGYDAIVGHDEDGWLDVIFSLPVTRGRVVLGTYLGRAVVLAGATVLGFGVVGLLLVREYGAARWGAFVIFLVAAVVLGLVFLAVALLISAAVGEKIQALGLALLAWVWFVLVHDLIALGIVAATSLPDTALTAMVALNPATVFRVLVLSQLGTTVNDGLAGALSATSLSPTLLVGALLAWIFVPLVGAIGLVRRRRL